MRENASTPRMKDDTEKIFSYCIHCAALCGVVAHVRDGYLIKVEGDPNALNNAGTLCPKALAAKQEVYHPGRLKFPMKRTKPKGDADPGWTRISWDQALDTIAARMKEIKAQYGPESFFLQKGSTGGSAGAEWYGFFNRLANLYGSPNFGGTGHICCYSRSCPGLPLHLGNKRLHPSIDYEKTNLIFLVGYNILHTEPPLARKIFDAQQRGAKLIVVDPLLSPTAAKADIWLAPRPGTDLALFLALHHVIIHEDLYDADFLSSWTNAPFLVREDSGLFLSGDGAPYMVWDSEHGAPCPADPWVPPHVRPALTGSYVVSGVACRPAWQLFSDLAGRCSPEWAQEITWVPADEIRRVARLYATTKPASTDWYNGIHRSSNAFYTAVALALLPIVTGNWDLPGALAFESDPPFNDVKGTRYLNKDWIHKSLVAAAGFKVRAHNQEYVGPMNLVADAILTGKPYPIRGMLSLASGLGTSNPNSKRMMEALRQLEFLAMGDIWQTPAMEMADLILPCATPWESEFVNYNAPYLMYRQPIVKPQHEAWPDLKIVFELAKRLGYAKEFWDGDIKKAFNYMLEPFQVTADELAASPRGIRHAPPQPRYRRYAAREEKNGKPKGVATPTGRLEIYSERLKSLGYDPLPYWREPEPGPFSTPELFREFPLILSSGFKPMHWLHGQLRAVPWLRECQEEPFVWINRRTALKLGVQDGEEVLVETPRRDGTVQGHARLKAMLTEAVHPQVIYIPYGWWQGCDSLGLNDYGNLDGSANVNNLYDDSFTDPVSGTIGMVSYPCRVRRE
ncbi:MAG: molybdopterin-dependent oxidoreductase [Deltaproteobacteria bacterium]|nr:molybdopterin-dependent oxidoreductase [Deltaproteobacteria bacterium]